MLEDNPYERSYLIDFGNNYPSQVHHRGTSIISIKVNSSFVTCSGGYATKYIWKANNPNLLTGAIASEPDAYNNFIDQRENYKHVQQCSYSGCAGSSPWRRQRS
ncbi:hypothetical protein MLD38_009957 [Melastoma candidum]|uniref:Uncharacterized protein n=1 Tax=Melastoma candidum TaxID=119954 RepID=A0ACB9QYV0_9MYRT|nr:hypothetical protein MLD38_009957 [Melastoma candidum]